MKNIIYALFIIGLMSCNKQKSQNEKLFRNIFNNTTWIDSDGNLWTFKTDKLIYVRDATDCIFFVEGLYNQVAYDGCIYNTVNNIVIEEDERIFAFKQVISSGTPMAGNSGSCSGSGGNDFILKFILLNETTIEVQTFYGENFDDSFIINKSNSTDTENCIDGTAAGILF